MTTLISKHKRLILLLMFTLVNSGTWAQQETGDSTTKDSASTEEKQTKTEEAADASAQTPEETSEETSEEKPEKAPQKSTDTFNPTEEISEDLSVSFPVDI